MRIPSVSTSIQSPVASLAQRQPKNSPAAKETPQAESAGTKQQPAAPISSNQYQGTYTIDPFNLAMLLSSQGATIMPPNLRLHPGQTSSAPQAGSVTSTETTGGTAPSGPLTASDVAKEIMDDFGSNGVLTVADVERAENGSTSAAAGDVNANTNADIEADFAQLSDGATSMTLAQLTSAVKKYTDPQNPQLNNAHGKMLLPGSSTYTSTTNEVPNPAASASALARVAALEKLLQEQRLAEVSNLGSGGKASA
jgi:hypothetical protein